MVARLKTSGLPFGGVCGVVDCPNIGCRIGSPDLGSATTLLNDGEDIEGGDVRPGELRADTVREWECAPRGVSCQFSTNSS